MKKESDVLLQSVVENGPMVLMEAAVVEALNRMGGIQLHPRLENALRIYDPNGRTALAALYDTFMDVGRRAGVPVALCAPTWRANRQRLMDAGIDMDVNGDAVRFMRSLDGVVSQAVIGGLLGCQNDCYQPDAALSADAARHFHAWQVERLAQAAPDFLMAATLPSVNEAAGLALAMGETTLPYLISFVINRHGCVLDGTPVAEAVDRIDALTPDPPLGYMINCAYPTFLNAADQPPTLFRRLIGFQANASSLDHDQLDGAADTLADDVSDWGDRMIALHRHHGIKILGGCCGTRVAHLSYLVAHMTSDTPAGGVACTDKRNAERDH